MNLTRCLAAATAALALIAAGCGGGDDDGGSATGTPEDAVRQAILEWTFEGDCDLMTDKFLEEQAFIGDTREERCDYFEKSFQKPQYEESDVKFRKVTVTGDTAVAVVGSDIANVESEYKLVAQGGEWKIDEVDLS